MGWNMNHIDRRRFLRGSGVALALPMFGSLSISSARGQEAVANPKRLGCFYFPDGVPMPLPEDPAYQDWAWFPHGNGSEFTFTKCMEPLEPLKGELTVLSGFSHPKVARRAWAQQRRPISYRGGNGRRRSRVPKYDFAGSRIRQACR